MSKIESKNEKLYNVTILSQSLSFQQSLKYKYSNEKGSSLIGPACWTALTIPGHNNIRCFILSSSIVSTTDSVVEGM